MKFQTSNGSIFNVFWWRKGQDRIPKWWILINGYRSSGVSLSNWPEQKPWGFPVFLQRSCNGRLTLSLTWRKGKCWRNNKSAVHKTCFTSKFGTPKAILEVRPEKGVSPIFLGSTKNVHKPWGNRFNVEIFLDRQPNSSSLGSISVLQD